MKIYSMTATFGKLDHETLTLQPGLNIIEAPNEWGKSTWCAFLTNMLYGIDTRARAKGTELPDKERYAPWSGAPMSGRMDLHWNGMDITIERRTKGRIPFGEFRAYETATGMDVPQLTATNCGEQLLGVERTVFARAGFLKLSDLPVTQDDALRRRLNNLVTTGDESGDGDRLGKTLKDLKNKCRHNQTGLLPQAERERDQLLQQQDALYALQKRSDSIRQRQEDLTRHTAALENHLAALQYEASLSDAQRVSEAKEAHALAQEAVSQQQAICDSLPNREAAQQALQDAQALLDRHLAWQMEMANLPEKPSEPEIPTFYRDLTDPVAAAGQDLDNYQALNTKRKRQNRWITVACVLAAIVCAACAAAAFFLPAHATLLLICGGGALAATCISSMVFMIVRTAKFRRNVDLLFQRHPGLSPDKWLSDAQSCAEMLSDYREHLALYQAAFDRQTKEKQLLDEETQALTGGMPLNQYQAQCNDTLAAWNKLTDAQREVQRALSHAQALESLMKPVAPAPLPDTLTETESETQAKLMSARLEQRQLQLELGQCQGKAESIGQEHTLRARLDALNRRINRLEDTYAALEMAQEALRNATTTLQRRFAPRISKRTQALFSRLTGNRYQRITLSEDLSLNACAEGEDTMLSAQWRSDGTVDQLYLALRLAVAEELTPNAPLVLDDALVRFDDKRLSTALEILKEAAESKQVILFTCQSRENKLS